MIQNKARVLRKGKWSVPKEKYPLDFYPQGRDYTSPQPHIFVSSAEKKNFQKFLKKLMAFGIFC